MVRLLSEPVLCQFVRHRDLRLTFEGRTFVYLQIYKLASLPAAQFMHRTRAPTVQH